MLTQTDPPVAELMTANVTTANRDDMLYDVIRKMEIESISALPIVDADHKVCGILSSADILGLAYNLHCDASSLSAMPNEARKTLLESIAEENRDLHVAGVMQSEVKKISPTATLVEAAQMLIDGAVHHLPVVDQSGKSVGIISTLDLVRAIAAAPARR